MELVLWGTPTVSIGSGDGYSNIDPNSDPDGLSNLQGEAEEMLVLHLVPGLVT